MLPCPAPDGWNCFSGVETDYRFSVTFCVYRTDNVPPLASPLMYATTTFPRFSGDQPTVRMDTHEQTVADNSPLQSNPNVVNTTGHDRLQNLQSLARRRAPDQSPEGVRRAASPACLNIGAENRLLFEQKRSPRQIATYNELRMHGIPANRIILEPRASSYTQPNASLKETIVHGDAPTLALRVHHGANPNERDEHGTPALITAAACGKTDAVRILAGAGAELNARDANQRTALLAASAAGHADTVIALLPYLPELDATDAQGMSALMHLCVHGHLAAARLLMANGANAALTAANGDDARRLAQRHGHHGIFDVPELMEDEPGGADGAASDIDMQ